MIGDRLDQPASVVRYVVFAVTLTAVVGAFFILVAGENPLHTYRVLLAVGFGLENDNLWTTLAIATPLILTGLSALVAFRSGLFSLGQEGQYLLGATATALVGYQVDLPAVLHVPLAMGAGVGVGAAYGFIPGYLKVRLNANELLVTIILNAIAGLIVGYLINGPMRAETSSVAYSPTIHDSAKLPAFVSQAHFGVGFIIAVAACGLVYVYLWRTPAGFEQLVAGRSRRFARYAGMPADRAQIRSMLQSGALAGLGGAIQVQGSSFRMIEGFSAGTGFDGLTIAVLGAVFPAGVLIVAILLAGIRYGAQTGLQVELGLPREIGGVLVGVAILVVAVSQVRGGALGSMLSRTSSTDTDELAGVGSG